MLPLTRTRQSPSQVPCANNEQFDWDPTCLFDDMALNKSYVVWRVWKTVNEMLDTRGYVVDNDSLTISLESFQARFPDAAEMQSDLEILASTRDGERILVFFLGGKIGVREIQACHDKMRPLAVSRAIIVIGDAITAIAKKTVAALEGVDIELFFKDELVINITKHTLVPRHEALTPDEKAALLVRYKLKETQLPRINTTDPVSRFLGLKAGAVVRITRKSETAGRYITYRLVV